MADSVLRESILPIAGPRGETLGLVACVGEGRSRRYFVVREGRRGFMLPVSRSYVMLGSAMRWVMDQERSMVMEAELCRG
jgi:hypothetical protein